MSEQWTPNIGNIPDSQARRDAIHVAVAPVIAGERLTPGCKVGKHEGLWLDWTGVKSPCTGIVDPFLSQPVERGELFWLFLLPGTVTSLRHVWTHPVFEPKAPT